MHKRRVMLALRYVQRIFLIYLVIYIGNHMNSSAIKDLHYERYLKILSKLHEPLRRELIERFSNITSSVDS